jgi:tetrahydromethanopterin S-methyltransferase subunit C
MNDITTTAAPGPGRGRLPRCLPMRLWKNAAATILTGLIITAWAVFLNGTRPGLTARGTTAVVLVLGIGVWVLYAWSIGTESRLATAFSYLALIAAVIGLITGSTVALAVLAAGTIALWLVGTAYTIIHPANPAPALVHQESDSHDRWRKSA